MENYAKVILYTYPLLKTVGKDYADHIRNKALLSYESAWDTERLTEYIAEEILRKERLEWLKSVVEEVLTELNDLEKSLVAIRYFGKRKKSQTAFQGNMSERDYFRRQQRLAEKLNKLLSGKGVTEEVYLRDFASLDIFEKIHRFIAEGKDKKRVANEWQFV
ncbi:MAG: hypothetical protein E7349_07350 [Clostridiales bacterium]|nr:hypothetical protein [Clostridiales bacterium]